MGGIALSTAVQALFYRLDVPKPWDPASKSPDGPVCAIAFPRRYPLMTGKMLTSLDHRVGRLHVCRFECHLPHQTLESFHSDYQYRLSA